MNKSQNNNFTIACDMDDVLMAPHTYIEFSKYLGIYELFSVPLIEYKSGKRSFESLLNNWFNIMTQLSTNDRKDAIKHVINTISEKTYRFVKNSKKLGRFIIVSNNDGDLVKSIAEKLNVEYIAVNKYIFEFCLITQRKSEAVIKRKINIDAAITDDPVNEKDFLDLPAGNGSKISCGIILCRNDISPDLYGIQYSQYKIVSTLDEVYEKLVIIKKDLGEKPIQ
jgi:hypothetical protein